MSGKSRLKPALFTAEEANRMLPLVKAIVEDITGKHREIKDLARQHRRLSHAGDEESAQTLAQELERQNEELARLTDELHDLGCTLKHPEDGLVDFPAIVDGHPAFLCWKLGEERVTHWHHIDAGFAGRKPLSQEESGPAGEAGGKT